MKAIKIQIPSLSENIRIVESFIDNAKDKYQINDESVNNAIKHGNNSMKDRNVELSLNFDDTTLKFIVSDQGSGFDYQNLPDPTAPENLDKPGGRGIFLMRHLCDEVTFQNNGSQVTLCFYLS